MEELDLGKVIELINKQGLEATLKQLDITEEQLREEGGYPIEQLLDGQEGVNSSMNEDFVPDYTKTAEWEGVDTDKVQLGRNISMDEIDPALLGMFGGKGQALKQGLSKLGNKIFASKALKTNQQAKRGVEGPVVTGASRTLKDSNLRPSIKNKTADKYKDMTSRVKQKNATDVAAGTAGAAIVGGAINRGLKGNRNAQGDFTVFDEDRLDPPTGPDMPSVEPDGVEETRPGWLMKDGQNFWTVNQDSDYWGTEEGGMEAEEMYGERPSWAKQQQPQQELDWDFWFKQ